MKLNKILKFIDFSNTQKLWNASKDKIDICKDCEYRYMCYDPRVPIERKDGSWYYETECSYNPYIAKWSNEKGYKNLKNCGIISNDEGFIINKKLLDKINKEIDEKEE